MTIATVPVYDATHAGIGSLPKGQAAGYTTGSGSVPWTAADWRAHPGAVRICQDPGATDTTADVLDVESGAATVSDVARWAEAAAASFASGRRPGQRSPAIYLNLSNLTLAVNALVAGKIVSGVSLWLANWNLTEAEATSLVQLAGGPYPVIGVQYGNRGGYDVSVFSAAWLANVSGGMQPGPGPAPVTHVSVTWALPVLSAGAAGEPARTVQGLLAARGHPVAVDGAFGPATTAAVKAVQTAAGTTADGIVGPLTWAALAGVASGA